MHIIIAIAAVLTVLIVFALLLGLAFLVVVCLAAEATEEIRREDYQQVEIYQC